ncbi:hypothetical protein [Streptomyces sp. NPDC005438]|uniref:hypothetical protein n=1 Tax=Streptomyces sp. NPDC005438 TaxID=3156880 RepID=UPI0033BC819B
MRRLTRTAGAGVAALGVLGVLPGPALADGSEDELRPYRFAQDAHRIKGTKKSTDAPKLPTGLSRDSLSDDETAYYRVTLDDKAHSYFSVTAAPKPRSEVDVRAYLRVRLLDPGDGECDQDDASFVNDSSAFPITAVVESAPEGGDCRPGQHLLAVTRVHSTDGDPEPWPVEINAMREPRIRPGQQLPAPSNEKGGSKGVEPPRVEGEPRKIRGGTGFNDAVGVQQGARRDLLLPGQFRYYRIPLEWGQTLRTSAEIANTQGDRTSVSAGLQLRVHNTVRGTVVGEEQTFTGMPQTINVQTPKVSYRNRDTGETDLEGARFSGWYYVSVALTGEVAEEAPDGLPVNVRFQVVGKPEKVPEYKTDPHAAGFGVSDRDRRQARDGRAADEAEDDGNKRLIAYAGLGAGTVLLVGLGLWFWLPRRRAAATADGPDTSEPPTTPAPPPAGYGYPGDGAQGGYGHPPQGGRDGYGYPQGGGSPDGR